MISERAKALLQAAATIYAAKGKSTMRGEAEDKRRHSVEEAEHLPSLIEAREPKATSREVPTGSPIVRCRCAGIPFPEAHPECPMHGCSCEVVGDNHLCPIHGG